MSKIQEWVYNLLVQIGLISENSSYLDNIVILLLIIAVTVGIDYSCRYFPRYVQTISEEDEKSTGRFNRGS